MKLSFDPFILFLLLAIVVSYLFPQLFLLQGGQVIKLITSIGVALIFFFYGLKLSFAQIKTGLSNWKLHVAVQVFTFLLFPVLLLLFRPFIHTALQEQFWLSFFFLATLPSTVSSSVVMVSIAKGNIPAAIFNASISGMIGVVITPLWMQLFLDFEGDHVLTDVYSGLLLEIILPVLSGLGLQRFWGRWAMKRSKILSRFDKTIILLIVYSSFAESFTSGIFDTIGASYLIAVFVGTILMFTLVWYIIDILGRKVLKLNREDHITALFCGSKKSLTHGSVFGKFLFAGIPSAGLYFLPLMVYHALQILIVTVIAQRYHNNKQDVEGHTS